MVKQPLDVELDAYFLKDFIDNKDLSEENKAILQYKMVDARVVYSVTLLLTLLYDTNSYIPVKRESGIVRIGGTQIESLLQLLIIQKNNVNRDLYFIESYAEKEATSIIEDLTNALAIYLNKQVNMSKEIIYPIF